MAHAKRLYELDIQFRCGQCEYVASSRQQLALHAFRVHGYHRGARARIDTEYCPVCLQLFHARERVICHVEEKSARCKFVLMHTFKALPANTVADLDARDAADSRLLRNKGRRRHHADAVTSRLHGPLCRAAFVAGVSHASLLRAKGAPVTSHMIPNIDCHSGVLPP